MIVLICFFAGCATAEKPKPRVILDFNEPQSMDYPMVDTFYNHSVKFETSGFCGLSSNISPEIFGKVLKDLERQTDSLSAEDRQIVRDFIIAVTIADSKALFLFLRTKFYSKIKDDSQRNFWRMVLLVAIRYKENQDCHRRENWKLKFLKKIKTYEKMFTFWLVDYFLLYEVGNNYKCQLSNRPKFLRK